MKRLIVCSDGLWSAPATAGDSNIALLAAAVAPVARDGAGQVVITDPYQGLPVAADQLDSRWLEFSVCSLYRGLALNYSPGDQLWLFGFSRGSYVVRSCIGMLRNVGLLKKAHLDRVADAWRIYRTRWGADARNGVSFRTAFSHRVGVKFLGVWDTLGPAGIPLASDTERSDLPGFHDTQLSSLVENACHALAIDERQRGHAACLWRTPADRTRTEQCWFAGNHRDIGGIQGDRGLANISLRWMLARAAALGLELDHDFLAAAMAQRGGASGDDYRNAKVGRAGTRLRPVGLTNSDETLHSSAEQRYLRNSRYRPVNLKAYMDRDEQIQLPW